MSDEYKQAEQAMLTDEVAKADVVITTALIPGRKAPVLIPEAMVAGMKRGSVIVDMASVNGGNVIGTVDGEKVVTKNGVSILGYSDLPSRLPTAASQLFGRNQANFLLSVGPQTTGTKGEFLIDYEDPAVRSSASRRVEAPSRHQTRSWVVSFPILSDRDAPRRSEACSSWTMGSSRGRRRPTSRRRPPNKLKWR